MTMSIAIAVLKETLAHERRVALVPSVAAKLVKIGARLHMQSGVGATAQFDDSAYQDVIFSSDRNQLVGQANIILAVQPPTLEVIDAMSAEAILISFIYAEKSPELVQRLLDKKITCFAMERIPRIARAQSMDAVSSQAALTGYYAVQFGATQLLKTLPKITTAAGIVGPAKVLVMGLGVAGLEAVATAHRLGAVVDAYDVRSETQEQALSRGASFVDTGVDARGHGGYARALNDAEKKQVDSVLSEHIRQADLIITTAAIPGKPSPKLISHEQVKAMKAGAVIIDLSAEGGGNCVDTLAGETIKIGDVSIVAPLNMASFLSSDASDLYSKNLYNFLTLILKNNVIAIDWDDEVLAKTALTHAGILKNGVALDRDAPGEQAALALQNTST